VASGYKLELSRNGAKQWLKHEQEEIKALSSEATVEQSAQKQATDINQAEAGWTIPADASSQQGQQHQSYEGFSTS
jgi:hypothetical protein